VLQERNYANISQKRFVSDPRGAVLTTFLVKFFSDYFDYDFTARLENDLDSVARGELDWKLLLQKFWVGFYAQIAILEPKSIDEITDAISVNLENYVFPQGREKDLNECKLCQSQNLKLRFGKFGMFLACTRYPECKFSQSVLIPSSTSIEPNNTIEESLIGLNQEGNEIFFGANIYGKYLKIKSQNSEVIKRVNLPKEYSRENMDLEIANYLTALPRTICSHPDNGAEVSLNISKFGLYLKCENKTANLNKIENPLNIDAKQALDLISQAKAKKFAVKKTLKITATKSRKSVKKLTK